MQTTKYGIQDPLQSDPYLPSKHSLLNSLNTTCRFVLLHAYGYVLTLYNEQVSLKITLIKYTCI